ncbi:hypothetical protein [Paenibacillus xylanexedens]|uniref:hypothetical protein n=1 Tax=Paenibacillus xylanexedens TaxID=528191 RepID=UPI000F54A4C2|nr:hypothetical protein [Paenibacillus xylanexedens]RPK28356.1 hypothetical protein EDO6_03883 [Paenibacillus xylanexedens]
MKIKLKNIDVASPTSDDIIKEMLSFKITSDDEVEKFIPGDLDTLMLELEKLNSDFKYSPVFNESPITRSDKMSKTKYVMNTKFFSIRETNALLGMLRHETFETGYSTQSEDYVRSLHKEDRNETLMWLNDIFIKQINDPTILVGILHILSHFDYKEVSPIGQTIAIAATAHENIEVKDYGIKAFENWGGIESLRLLKALHYSEKWLQNYVDAVITDLEEELGLDVVSS